MSQRESVVFDGGQCWSGWCDISPKRPVPLAGYAGAERLSAGNASGIEANWLVFPVAEGPVVLLIAIDALFSSQAFEDAVIDALSAEGIVVSGLWVVASHTHFAPQLDPTKPKLGRHDPDHMTEVAQRIANAVRSGMDAPPVRIGELRHGTAPAPGAVHRRRTGWKLLTSPPFVRLMAISAPAPEVEICPDLRLWILHDAASTARAAVVHWSCHTVASHPRNWISATHIGAIRGALRDRFGPALPVIAMTGCSGDIRPDFRASVWSRRALAPYPFQPGFALPTPESVQRFEAGIVDATQRAAAQTTALPQVEAGRLVRVTSELLAGVGLTVTRLEIGPLTVLSMNCEPSHDWVTELGLDHRAPDVAVTGYAGEVFGYLPTEKQIRQGGYEVDGFRNAFGFRGDWRALSALRDTVLSAFLTSKSHDSALL
jgi:hypothetical protein